MGSKYRIMYASYPFDGCYEGEYQTNWFVNFFFKFIGLKRKYQIIEVSYRNFD